MDNIIFVEVSKPSGDVANLLSDEYRYFDVHVYGKDGPMLELQTNGFWSSL
jgi:hypothetical protein